MPVQEPLPDFLLPYEQQIKILSERLDQYATTPVAEWLQNFERDEVKSILPLLERFRFIDKTKIRGWAQKLHYRALRGRDSSKVAIIGLGPAGKSGTHLLFDYGKASYLSTDQLFSHDALSVCLSRGFRDLIFLDDVIGSGQQAGEFFAQYSHEIENSRIVYAAMIGLADSIRTLEERHSIQVLVKETLRESDKPFRSRYVFSSEEDASRAMQICKRYGHDLFPDHPLGYRDCQMLIAFAHNTPDNTLPIFWSEVGGWSPLFARSLNKPGPLQELSSNPIASDILFLGNVSKIIAGAVRHSLAQNGPVIWIDDNPDNNQLETAAMRALGIKVIEGTTTTDAMRLMNQIDDPALFITDMTRIENGQSDPRAGLNLIQSLRDEGKSFPILIYTESFVQPSKPLPSDVTVIEHPENLIIEVIKRLGAG